MSSSDFVDILKMNKEHKRYYKIAFLYIFLTTALIVSILKFGLAGAIKISEIIQRGKPIEESNLYENILPVPQFYPIIEATNSAALILSGYSLPNNNVDIYLNDFNVKSFEVDSEGKFIGDISLSLGICTIYGITKDNQNKQSPKSKTWTIFYGNSPPYLEILEPANDSVIKSKNSLIDLKGKALNVSKVTINDHLIILEKDGAFTYQVKLQTGDNKFKIICLDPAQNQTELEWNLKYQP